MREARLKSKRDQVHSARACSLLLCVNELYGCVEQWLRTLERLQMTPEDASKYNGYLSRVSRSVARLRVVLQGLEAKKQERIWMKRQPLGEIDDTLLVDGLTGDKSIYRRRSKQGRLLVSWESIRSARASSNPGCTSVCEYCVQS